MQYIYCTGNPWLHAKDGINDTWVAYSDRYIVHCFKKMDAISTPYTMEDDLYNLIYYRKSIKNKYKPKVWQLQTKLKFLDSQDLVQLPPYNFKHSCCVREINQDCGECTLRASSNSLVEFSNVPNVEFKYSGSFDEIGIELTPVFIATYLHEHFIDDRKSYSRKKVVFFEGCTSGSREGIIRNRIVHAFEIALKLAKNGEIPNSRKIMSDIFERYAPLYDAVILKASERVKISDDVAKMIQEYDSKHIGGSDSKIAIKKYLDDAKKNLEIYIDSAVKNIEIKYLTVVRLFCDKCMEIIDDEKPIKANYETAIKKQFTEVIDKKTSDLFNAIWNKAYKKDNFVVAGNDLAKDFIELLKCLDSLSW